MKGLTSEFGMGSGITLSLLPPSKKINLLYHLYKSTLEVYSSLNYILTCLILTTLP